MATREEVLAALKEILYDIAGVKPDAVTNEKSFSDDLGIDSLSMVEVVVAAEERLKVSIPDKAINNLKTVGDVVNYVMKHGS